MQFRSHTLPNGLDVIAECNDEANTSAVGFFVKTGARDETDEVSGVSHFLEHMVFKGTPKRSAEDVNREFDELGAHYNAFTSEEKTVYYAAVLPEYVRPTVELWADVLRPSLRTEDFDTEKQVILEEIKMYEDQPPFGADDKIRAIHFGKHPLGRSVLGTVQTVGALSVDQMRGYFSRRYSPDNILLAASGKVDFDDLVATAEKVCGDWQRTDAGRVIEPAAPHSGFECIHKESATQEYVIQFANGPMASDPDRVPAKILTTIIGDDEGSRLYWELVDPGLAENASLSHHDHFGAGLFITYLAQDPEYAQKNMQCVLDVYREVESKGVTDSELTLAKNKLASRIVIGSEKPRNRLFSIGQNWSYRHEYRTPKDDLDIIDAVTQDDIRRVLKKFPLTTATTLAIGPLKKLKPAK